MKKLILVVLISLIMVSGAYAFTVNVTGAEVTVTYTEPTTNEDGSPLLDLNFCSIFYDMGDGPTKAIDITASKPTGGGTISTNFIVPVLDGMERDVSVWGTASDGSNNASAESVKDSVRIDRLAPNTLQ